MLTNPRLVQQFCPRWFEQYEAWKDLGSSLLRSVFFAGFYFRSMIAFVLLASCSTSQEQPGECSKACYVFSI